MFLNTALPRRFLGSIPLTACSRILSGNLFISSAGVEITITKRNGQKSKDEETEEIKEQERNQRLAAKRALERKEQLEKAELDKRYQQSLLEAAWLYGRNLL